MLNFERGKPTTNNVKDPAKPSLKPPIYEPPAAPATPSAGS